MKSQMSIKFPCGYEFYVTYESGIFDISSLKLNADSMPECPLHAKKCL